MLVAGFGFRDARFAASSPSPGQVSASDRTQRERDCGSTHDGGKSASPEAQDGLYGRRRQAKPCATAMDRSRARENATSARGVPRDATVTGIGGERRCRRTSPPRPPVLRGWPLFPETWIRGDNRPRPRPHRHTRQLRGTHVGVDAGPRSRAACSSRAKSISPLRGAQQYVSEMK